jgi:hypothetical protein
MLFAPRVKNEFKMKKSTDFYRLAARQIQREFSKRRRTILLLPPSRAEIR